MQIWKKTNWSGTHQCSDFMTTSGPGTDDDDISVFGPIAQISSLNVICLKESITFWTGGNVITIYVPCPFRAWSAMALYKFMSLETQSNI